MSCADMESASPLLFCCASRFFFAVKVGEVVMYLPQGHANYLRHFPENNTPPYKLFKGRPAVVRCQVRERSVKHHGYRLSQPPFPPPPRLVGDEPVSCPYIKLVARSMISPGIVWIKVWKKPLRRTEEKAKKRA